MRAALKRVAIIAAGVIVALFVVGTIDLFDFLPNPFERSTVDRSQPALLERAERNTRTMLTALLRSLGFDTVNVAFEQPPS